MYLKVIKVFNIHICRHVFVYKLGLQRRFAGDESLVSDKFEEIKEIFYDLRTR